MATATEVKELYGRLTRRKVLFISLLVVALILLAIGATSIGSSSLGFGDAARVIASKVFPFAHIHISSVENAIIWHIRFPRVILALLAGVGFAASGTAMQGVLRNPLVSPYTLGLSSGAAFGAALAIVTGVGVVGSGNYLIILNAFIFALLTMALVYGIARIRGITPETMILAGIAVTYLFMAGVSLLEYTAGEELATIVYWIMGSLTAASWHQIYFVLPVVLICVPLMMRYAWDLNVMGAGDEVATSLGTNVKRVRVICLTLATIVTATIISFTGIIGFIGLVAPHITRMIIGGDHRFLLPCSCLVGAIILLSADTLARTIIAPTMIPVGIMTAFLGVPFFIFLLVRKRREFWQ
jgi:iron complex transport system permease protein